MEQWSVDEERPYLRPQRSFYSWIVGALALALAGAVGYYYYYFYFQPTAPASSAPLTEAPLAPQAEAPAAPPQAGVRNPLREAAAGSLPTLENSDSMMRESIAGLLGRKAFEDFVVPDQLVRRIVATVDNLPRPTAPRRTLPLNRVPGSLVAAPAGEDWTIDPANAARYAPFVRVLEAARTRALVWSYVQAYPLFQRAYEELGFSGKYFNDRLVEAIDDLLAAPEAAGPVRLMHDKVLFEFADPDLETRSAGQKIMVRMGADNAARVKGKLREIRVGIVGVGNK
jgi:Protein of unknown function (DUF3014)